MRRFKEKYHFKFIIFKGDVLQIYVVPDKLEVCFTVVDSKSGEYCRISILDAEYIGREDEKLKLDKDKIKLMIFILYSKCGYCEEYTCWEYMINCWNLIIEGKRNLKPNSAIPDYRLLVEDY